jgi:hypothetical protein
MVLSFHRKETRSKGKCLQKIDPHFSTTNAPTAVSSQTDTGWLHQNKPGLKLSFNFSNPFWYTEMKKRPLEMLGQPYNKGSTAYSTRTFPTPDTISIYASEN